jgi:hypothetical protein
VLNSKVRELDIIFILELWWARIGMNKNGQKIVGLIKQGVWTPILPKSTLNPGDPLPRVMTYFRHRQDFKIMLWSDITQDRDIQVLEVTQERALKTTIMVVYNDPKETRPAIKRMKYLDIPNNHLIIYTGDWNIHHELWAYNNKRGNRGSQRFIDWPSDKELLC